MWIFQSYFVFIAVLVHFCESKSAKKGVCIPPGTNFHCGDLAAFNNVRSAHDDANPNIFEGVVVKESICK